MGQAAGWAIVGVSTALLLMTVFGLRTRFAPPAVDAVLAVGGAGLGVGGLLALGDAGVGSWIVGPLAIAMFAVLHVRALFAGSGPFRT